MASIFDILLTDTLSEVHVWSLPNVKGQGDERWIGSRKLTRLEGFVSKRDKPGYGTFFCVSTIAVGTKRVKANARELPFLFADVDFKNIDLPPEKIEEILRNLPCPPSRMHHSGYGIHCFWVMDQAFYSDEMELAESLLRRLARHVGGDPQVAHRVALLRVPGTVNSKRGGSVPVRVIREGAETYTPDQIGAWLDAVNGPAIVRRDAEDENPFLRRANDQGYRPPLDVERALAEMTEGNIHDTQLRVTASLMSVGVEIEDAVALVLDATRALSFTSAWDWRLEERNIRQMCVDALHKFGEREKPVELRSINEALAPLIGQAQPPQQVATVVSFADARKKREEPAENSDDREARKDRARTQVKKKNEHIFLGEGILEELEMKGHKLMYADNMAWLYKNGVWTSMTGDEEKTWINVQVERGARLARMTSTSKIVNETRQWLQRNPELHEENVEWDAHGMIATKDGLYDWRDDTIDQIRPDDYVTRLIDVPFKEDATCPVWERMLADDYGFDEPTIAFLQELLGVSLVMKKPRTLTRALVLHGPSNTGKSNILNVFAGLISPNHNTTELKLIENTHGLMSFLKPDPWVLHEAFDQSRWEMSATVKALLSSDPVQVNVKNGPLIPVVFRQPIFWGTNVAPQFKEASRAMENRLAIVKMKKVYNPSRIVGTAREAIEKGYRNPAELVLATEKAGVLQWAIKGLRRAWDRGHFEFTEEMNEALHAMRMDSNMATGFIFACCEYDPDSYVLTSDFYGAFQVWHRDHRGGQSPSVDMLGRAMSSLADPRIITDRVNRQRIYAGVKLNEEGLDCWNAYASSMIAERSGLRISGATEEVNRTISPEAAQRWEFQEMARAHREWVSDQD